MKILYFDCFSGISGDMTLGALLDLGIDENSFREELKKLDIDGYHLVITRASKNGIEGTSITVHLMNESSQSYEHCHHHDNEEGHEHHHRHDLGHFHEHHHRHDLEHSHEHNNDNCNHEHEHEHEGEHEHKLEHKHEHTDHDHRTFKDIKYIIDRSSISDRAKEYSVKIFKKLAEAEGKIHGKPAEDVSFHEVGAIDSIVDIVGTGILLDMLDVDVIKASPIPLGGGVVRCQHGLIPVPAPATLELLKGIPVYTNNVKSEITTPTGAAILSSLCDEFCDYPSMVIKKIGYGMGRKDFDLPNCLRICLGQEEKKTVFEEVKIIECNIDDMSGEIFGFLMERLFKAGALDVWYTPVYMKKNRPGVMINVLCHSSKEMELSKIILNETTSLGVRSYSVDRKILNRDIISVDTPYGTVSFKIAKGFGIEKAAPEYEDVKRLAEENKIPFKAVYEAAMKSFAVITR